MAKKFRELREKMSPERRRGNDRITKSRVAVLEASEPEGQSERGRIATGAVARASNVVSFNIEMLTSVAFAAAQGGAFIVRTYLPPDRYTAARLDPKFGTVGNTMYFPHGLLDTQGNCVMTRSEYHLHGASLAARAAVSLCLGGDLLVLGMSLSDHYLRETILKERRWIRDIYWVDEEFPHAEWARVAGVTCIQAKHSDVWATLAEAAVTADTRGDLRRNRDRVRDLLPTHLAELISTVREMPTYMAILAREVVSLQHAGAPARAGAAR